MSLPGMMRGRSDLLATVTLAAGIILSILLVSRSDWPEYPNDLMSYMGATFAAADGTDPYSVPDQIRALEARGIHVDNLYGYVYSPMFIVCMQHSRIIPFSHFRFAFRCLGLLVVWAALWLLCLSLRGSSRLLMALAGSVFLLVSSVLYDCLYWGQVTGWMLLALAVMVFRRYRGIIAGLAATVLAVLKAGYIPFILLLGDRRSWATLCAVLLVLVLVSLALMDPEVYSEWFGRLGQMGGGMNVNLSNNLSLAGLVGNVTSRWLTPKADMDRASNDPEYRMENAALKARRIRTATLSVTLLLLAVTSLRLLLMTGRGGVSRDYLLSLGLLLSLALLPFVWLHYGLMLLVPLWYLVSLGKLRTAVLMTATFLLWGLPLDVGPGIWTGIPGIRSIVPLGWSVWLLTVGAQRTDISQKPDIISI